MAPHTLAPVLGVVCHCKAKAGLRRSPQGLHTRTRFVITAEIESGFASLKTIWFRSAAYQFPLQTEAWMCGS
ncbi:hypothetical protein TNCV_5065151 [Trichonephila clavipes]|nr:hypothetical protein TNCV_5065151 [Trichonephila clavipes]